MSSRRNVGRIAGYVTEVAYMEVGEGREQDAAALQHRRQGKRQVIQVDYLFRVALVLLCQITNVGCVVRTIALTKGQTMPIGAYNASYRNMFE